MVVSRQFGYSKTSKNDLQGRRTSQIIANLGLTVGSRFNSLINSSDEMLCFESLRLGHVRWILDGPSRFFHVTRVISNA